MSAVSWVWTWHRQGCEGAGMWHPLTLWWRQLCHPTQGAGPFPLLLHARGAGIGGWVGCLPGKRMPSAPPAPGKMSHNRILNVTNVVDAKIFKYTGSKTNETPSDTCFPPGQFVLVWPYLKLRVGFSYSWLWVLEKIVSIWDSHHFLGKGKNLSL